MKLFHRAGTVAEKAHLLGHSAIAEGLKGTQKMTILPDLVEWREIIIDRQSQKTP